MVPRVILVILAVLLIILAVTLACLVGRREKILGIAGGGARRTFGGAKRRLEIAAALDIPVDKILHMKWHTPSIQPGEFHMFEAIVAKDEITAVGPYGPPHRGPFLLVVKKPSRWNRDTVIIPQNLAATAYETAKHIYAWILFDVPEGKYAIRRDSPLADGAKAALSSEMRAALKGSPPHKMFPEDLIKILRLHDFDVQFYAPESAEREARFMPATFRTDVELKQEREKLFRMDQQSFDALDWSDPDGKLVPLLDSERERSGQLEITDGRVKVLKIREGGPSHVISDPRAAIEYHTHPRRGEGFVENPSGADLKNAVRQAASGVVWSVVVAPEGYYVYAPGEALRLLEPKQLQDLIAGYEEWQCTARPPTCLQDSLAFMRRLGFTVWFRPNAAWASAVEKMPPYYGWNDVDTEKFWAQHAEVQKLGGKALLDKFDWSPIIAAFTATVAIDNSWMPVEIGTEPPRLAPLPGGHVSEPGNPPNWTVAGSPVVVLFHPDGQLFTKAELHNFRTARRADLLVALLLVTPTTLAVLTDPARTAQELPSGGPDSPRLETVSEYGYTVDSRPR